MLELIHKSKSVSLPITVHLGEIPGKEEETTTLLKARPDRIGHGTFFNTSSRVDLLNLSIPIEICLTSNVFCKTVDSYMTHHFKDYKLDNHPCILCVG